MASASVYYKFKSQKEPSRITFDGTGISVWDLKREIILQNKMGKGIDFDLGIYNADTEEEYKDDNFIVPRSSQVIARRLPPSKPGRGTAQMYVADASGGGGGDGGRFSGNTNASGVKGGDGKGSMYRGPMTMRFDQKDGSAPSNGSGSSQPAISSVAISQNASEADSIAAMFQATTAQWDETQERMSHATYRDRGGAPRRGGPPRQHMASQRPQHSDRPPPNGYVCFRCGQKGHWIQECPTNDDRDFDNRPRFKRTTGIPKSMLKTVEQPTDEQKQAGVMVTPDGSYVVAQPDSETWRKNRVRSKLLTQSDVYQSVPTDSSLACPLCSKLLRDAVQTPCCSTRYCEECIQTHLLEHDFTCAECDKRISDLEKLKTDDETRQKVREYVRQAIEKSEKEIEEETKRGEEEAGAKANTANAQQSTPHTREGSEARSTPGPASKHALPMKPSDPTGQASAAAANSGAGRDGRSPGLGGTSERRSSSVNPSDSAGAMGNAMMNGMGGMAMNQAQWGANNANGGVQFNPQTVQQIMMMLQNPQLTPPMRMQLQMQLQMQQFAFMQQMQAQQQGMMGGGMGMGGMNGMGGMGGVGMAMGMGMGGGGNGGMSMMSNNQQWNGQHGAPTNPYSMRQPHNNEQSAYMRLPVNNKRNQGQKRERPTDVLEVAGSSNFGQARDDVGPNKSARTS
ncbi:Protein mpe1 [Thecaphora frezii]